MSRQPYSRKTKDAPVLTRLDEPNWSKLIDDLVKLHVPKKQIAERCEMYRQTLYGIWENGVKPNWRQGQLLINLHRRLVK